MEFDIDEIKLKTIANLPYKYKNIPIKPKTIGEIIDYSYRLFNQQLSLCSLSINDVFPGVDNPDILNLPLFEVLLESNNIDFLFRYKSSFEYFLEEKIQLLTESRLLQIKEHVIEFRDLDTISKIIMIQNSVVNDNRSEFNPLNDRAKDLQEKIMKRRQKLKKLKKEDENNEQISFLDLVSVLSSSGNGINVFNVFQLNYYQFNDQFNRMVMIDKYQTDIQSLLHGADSNKLELKHWISKMG